MPTGGNSMIEVELGQDLFPMAALTDSGDNKTFSSTAAPWSSWSGFAPKIRPNGVLTGCLIIPHADADKVSISAGSVYIAGVLITVPAGTVTITRDGSDPFLVTSICVDATPALSAEAGVAHASAFGDRDAAGGPALIPATKIELGQLRTSSITSAEITIDEIKQQRNVHREESNSPQAKPVNKDGSVVFTQALMLNHVGDLPKAVYAEVAEPVYTEAEDAYGISVPEITNSVASQAVTSNRTVGSTSKSLTAGGFTMFIRDGINDPIIAAKDQKVWVRYFPVIGQSSHLRGQAILGLARTYETDSNFTAVVTLTAEEEFERVFA